MPEERPEMGGLPPETGPASRDGNQASADLVFSRLFSAVHVTAANVHEKSQAASDYAFCQSSGLCPGDSTVVPNLPSAAEIKMRAVRDLAQEVRGKLEESLQAIERFRSGCLRLGDSPRHVLHVQPFAHAEVAPQGFISISCCAFAHYNNAADMNVDSPSSPRPSALSGDLSCTFWLPQTL
jgi:hypothetical protein